MEESKKTLNDREKKKVVIKMGGGGGIGAVILLGGVLAATALASAFLVRGKGRSSAKDRSPRHQNPPPESNKQGGQDEADKGQEITSTDTDQPSHVDEHQSKGAINEVESDNDAKAFLVSTESLTMGEETKVEINGGTPCDVEASEQILCSISPKKLEKDVVFDDGFVIVEEDFPLLDEKLPLEIQNKMPEDEETEVQLSKEDAPNDYSKESKNLEQVYTEEERAESEQIDDGKIEAMRYKEAVEVTEKKENMELEMEKKVEEKEGTETVEIVQEGEAVEESQEDEVKYIDEKSVEEEEKCNRPDVEAKQSNQLSNLIEEKVDNIFIPYQNEEENGYKDHKDDLERDSEKEVEEERIFHGKIEATKDDILNVESAVKSEKSDQIMEFSSDDDEEKSADTLSDEVEESSLTGDSSTESNCEAVWPAESMVVSSMEPQKVKLINNEVKGKIQQGKAVKLEGKVDSQINGEKSSFEKSLMKKYVVEMGMVKDHPTNSTRRRMVVGTLSVLSSLSCSWFFGLSFVKLCLVVFFTIVLSEIHAY